MFGRLHALDPVVEEAKLSEAVDPVEGEMKMTVSVSTSLSQTQTPVDQETEPSERTLGEAPDNEKLEDAAALRTPKLRPACKRFTS